MSGDLCLSAHDNEWGKELVGNSVRTCACVHVCICACMCVYCV